MKNTTKCKNCRHWALVTWISTSNRHSDTWFCVIGKPQIRNDLNGCPKWEAPDPEPEHLLIGSGKPTEY